MVRLLPYHLLCSPPKARSPSLPRCAKRWASPTGDRVYFIRNPQTGCYEVTRKTGSVKDLFGFLKHEGPAVTIDQMNDDIAQYLGEDDERIKREWHERQDEGGGH